MKSDCRFFQKIERRFRLPHFADPFVLGAADSTSQLGCKFQPLGFAAAQGWARLAELQVAESRIDKKRERPRNLRIGGKELGRLLDRHLHDVADALIVIEDLE